MANSVSIEIFDAATNKRHVILIQRNGDSTGSPATEVTIGGGLQTTADVSRVLQALEEASTLLRTIRG